MSKKGIQTSAAPRAIGPYSQAIGFGPFVFCSGQIALDPQSGAMSDAGVADQTHQVMENLGAVLSAAGAEWANVVKTTIYLTDLADFQTVNDVYSRYFGETPPARATVQVAALPKGAAVEIDAIACVAGR